MRAPLAPALVPVTVTLLATLAPAGIAAAGPLSAGVAIGSSHAEAEADAGADARRAWSVYGRLGLTRRLAAQVELGRLDGADVGATIRQVTALAVVDVARLGALVPIAFAGLGADRVEAAYGVASDARRLEAGVGLEYRAAGGLTVGLDVRVGRRTLDEPVYAEPGWDTRGGAPLDRPHDPVAPRHPVSETSSDGFRGARLTLGVRF